MAHAAELAVTGRYDVPTDLPDGDCICTRLDGGQIRIDRADPRILISAELLRLLGTDDQLQGVSLDLPVKKTFVGALLKIRAVDRTVIYAITEYVPSVNGYIGQWPD
jgi:hypothetical protein